MSCTSNLDGLIDGFLLCLATEGRSPETVEAYEGRLEELKNWLQKHAKDGEITIHELRGFVRHLQTRKRKPGYRYTSNLDKNLSPATVRAYTVAIRSFFRWIYEDGYSETNLAARLKIPNVPKQVVAALTAAEIERFISVIDKNDRRGYRAYAMVLLMLDCGIRVGELCRLRLSDVDLKIGRVKAKGKGAKERYVPIGLRTRRVLWRYVNKFRAERPWVWTDHFFVGDTGNPVTTNAVQHSFRYYSGKSGVKITPHMLRHTFATNWLRKKDPLSLQRILGHAQLDMVNRYVHAVFEDLAEAHRVASPVDNMRL